MDSEYFRRILAPNWYLEANALASITSLIFFLAGYYFVLSDFVSYQAQVSRYPYKDKSIARFFLDVAVFFVLFWVLNLASSIPTPLNVALFLFFVGMWHMLVFAWQLKINFEYSRSMWRGTPHVIRALVYWAILAIFLIVYHKGRLAEWECSETKEVCITEIFDWTISVSCLVFISNSLRILVFLNPDFTVFGHKMSKYL